VPLYTNTHQVTLYCRYYLGIPEGRPGQLHLYRTSSVTPRLGEQLSVPHCLTCQPEPNGPPPYSAYYAYMAGGRPGTGSEDDTDDWREDGDEMTPTSTLSPMHKRRGEFNTLSYELQ